MIIVVEALAYSFKADGPDYSMLGVSAMLESGSSCFGNCPDDVFACASGESVCNNETPPLICN